MGRKTMLEYPEINTIVKQMRETLKGKTVEEASFGAAAKKFVFTKETPEEFRERLVGQTITEIESCSNHLYIMTDGGQCLQIGDTGGRILYHADESTIPKKRDLLVVFSDGSTLSVAVQMWGFMRAYSREEASEHQRRVLTEARLPIEDAVSEDDLLKFMAGWEDKVRTSAKKFIISRKYVTGLGNGYVQDILWRAGIYPRRKMASLSSEELTRLLTAILSVAREAVAAGGHNVERDLYNNPGGYAHALGKATLGEPCSKCLTPIEKFSFEGGACYVCPNCQKAKS
jgi:formamidopyrimidine-DNA glycosylase